MKKGFTLVELLAVISIISSITLVAIPGVNMIKNEVNKNMFCKKVELILNASERYAEVHKNALSLRNNNVEDGSPCLVNKTVKELIDAGVIDSEASSVSTFKNPMTNEEMLNDKVAFYMKGENVYAIYQEDESSMIEGQKKYIEICNVKDEDHMYEVNLCGVEHRTKREDEEEKKGTLEISEQTVKVDSFNVKSITSLYNNRKVKIESRVSGDANPKVCVSTTGFGIGCNYENYSNSISLTLANSDDAYKDGKTYTIYVAFRASNGSVSTVKSDYKLYKYCDNETDYVKVSDNKTTCGKCGVPTYKESQKTNDKYFSSISCSTRDVDKSCDHPSCCGDGNEKDVYSSWSACSKKCDTGTQTRTYKVVSKWDESKVCKTSITQTQKCNTMSCCSSKTITSYSNWGGCSKTCGGGTQTRTGYYTSNYDGSSCGTKTESKSCNTMSCCSSKAITSYSNWGGCSKTCGGGTQTRTGYYTSNYDSSSCGTTTESRSCNTQSCSYQAKTRTVIKTPSSKKVPSCSYPYELDLDLIYGKHKCVAPSYLCFNVNTNKCANYTQVQSGCKRRGKAPETCIGPFYPGGQPTCFSTGVAPCIEYYYTNVCIAYVQEYKCPDPQNPKYYNDPYCENGDLDCLSTSASGYSKFTLYNSMGSSYTTYCGCKVTEYYCDSRFHLEGKMCVQN